MQNRSKKNQILTLLFLNSSGAWCSWISMGPFLVQSNNSLIRFGILAFIRQIFMFLGTFFAEIKSIHPNKSIAHAVVEASLILTNVAGLICLFALSNEHMIYWASIWGIVRFFFAGIGVVTSYQILSTEVNPSSSIVQQLAIMQGSVVVGALLCIGLELIYAKQLVAMALTTDLLSSLIFVIWLFKNNLGNTEKPRAKETFSLKKLGEPVKNLFIFLPLPKSLGYILTLLSVAALPTIQLSFSKSQESTSTTFSVFNMFSGILFISGGLLFSTTLKPLATLQKYFAVLLISLISSIALYSWHQDQVTLLLLTATSVLVLLLSSKIAMADAGLNQSSSLRSSLALYLNLIFGTAEILCAWFIEMGALRTILILKMFFVIGILYCFKVLHASSQK